MTKRVRFGLLLVGFLFFLAAAPTLVFYIQGRLPSLGGHRAVDTGIISIESNPSKASIYINNELTDDQTPAAVRFLSSGDYELKLEKPGYRTWSKRLSVMAGKVTHAGPEPEKLILLKDEPTTVVAESGISSFYIKNNLIVAFNQSSTSLEVLTEQGQVKNKISIGYVPDKVLFDQKSDEVLVLGQGSVGTAELESTNSYKKLDLKLDNFEQLKFNSKILYWIEKNQLKTYNLETKITTTLLQNALTFELTSDAIYFLSTEQDKTTLEYAFLSHNGQVTNRQTLATNLPDFNKPTLLIDNSKAVFTLDNGTLSRINQTTEELARGVTLANTSGGTLTYSLPGELWWYESSANRSHIISRTSDSYHAAYLDTKLQYILFSSSEGLSALEINSEGGQNRYILSNQEISNFQRKDKSLVFLTKKGVLSLLPLFP